MVVGANHHANSLSSLEKSVNQNTVRHVLWETICVLKPRAITVGNTLMRKRRDAISARFNIAVRDLEYLSSPIVPQKFTWSVRKRLFLTKFCLFRLRNFNDVIVPLDKRIYSCTFSSSCVPQKDATVLALIL